MEDKKPTYIGGFSFKSVTASGNRCKTYCDIYDDGRTIVNQLILTKAPQEEMPRFTLIYSKFGYNLYVKEVGFKYSSLLTIVEGVAETLADAKINIKDIL